MDRPVGAADIRAIAPHHHAEPGNEAHAGAPRATQLNGWAARVTPHTFANVLLVAGVIVIGFQGNERLMRQVLPVILAGLALSGGASLMQMLFRPRNSGTTVNTQVNPLNTPMAEVTTYTAATFLISAIALLDGVYKINSGDATKGWMITGASLALAGMTAMLLTIPDLLSS